MYPAHPIPSILQCIHLYDIRRKPFKVTQKYAGHVQKRFVIRSCFGGANQLFVLSGSEGVWCQNQGYQGCLSNLQASVDSLRKACCWLDMRNQTFMRLPFFVLR